MKQCSKCKQWKTESEFYKDSTKSDKLQSICKSCSKKLYLERKEYHQSYYKSIKESKKEYQRQWNRDNKDHKREQAKLYYEANKDRINEERRIKYNNSLQMQFNNKITKIVTRIIKRQNSTLFAEFETSVGYTIEQFRQHIESQFDDEMNWDNYGVYWELDHIIPRNLFNITGYDSPDFKICWSLQNLRPLSIGDNKNRPKDGRDISEQTKNNIMKTD